MLDIKKSRFEKSLKESLIIVFLGYLGVHKFLKKDSKMGWIYLFTVGLFGIGWIIDSCVSIADTIKKYNDYTNQVETKEKIDVPIIEIKKVEEKKIEEVNDVCADTTNEEENFDGMIKITDSEGNVTEHKYYEQVLNDELCIFSDADGCYHKEIECYKNLSKELQKIVIANGYKIDKVEVAKGIGKKECPLCFEKGLSDTYKFNRMLESGKFIEFKALRTNRGKAQELIQMLSSGDCLMAGLSDNIVDWYLYSPIDFDFKKSEFIPCAYVPRKIKELFHENFEKTGFENAYIFVKELIEKDNGLFELICYLDLSFTKRCKNQC